MSDRITLTTVKSMGFTKKLIEELLPEPELVPNPHYKCAPPMKLWEKSDVEKAMKTTEFKESQKKREKRQNAARKAVQTKTDNLIDKVMKNAENIRVERLEMDVLLKKTLQAKQNHYDNWYWNYGCYRFDEDYIKSAYGADDDTQKRWMVNYIRHCLTLYDDDLLDMYRKTGKNKAYFIYFEAVLKKIAEVYPELKDECDSQIAYKKWQYAA